MSRPNRYRLKGSPTEYETVDKVCIACGRHKPTHLPKTPGLPRPNTTPTYGNGHLSAAGTVLGCFLGNHDYYFEYELEEAS